MENLHALCRVHHGFKHHAGWTVRMDPDGTCHWSTPTGHHFTTGPWHYPPNHDPPDQLDQAA